MIAPNTSAQLVPTYPDIRIGIDGQFVIGFRNRQQSADFRAIEHPVERGRMLAVQYPSDALDLVYTADVVWRDWLNRRQQRGGVTA